MPLENPEILNRARGGRDKLVAQLIHHPDVTLIDIGLPPDAGEAVTDEDIVIRVHVREHWFAMRPEMRPEVPETIDGIRVIIIPGDYHLE